MNEQLDKIQAQLDALCKHVGFVWVPPADPKLCCSLGYFEDVSLAFYVQRSVAYVLLKRNPFKITVQYNGKNEMFSIALEPDVAYSYYRSVTVTLGDKRFFIRVSIVGFPEPDQIRVRDLEELCKDPDFRDAFAKAWRE